MPKYRLLTTSELIQFEKEFIDYLIVNGIDAPTWEKIKVEESEKAERIIELFSDVVFEKILRKTTYLVKLTPRLAFAFKYLEDRAQLYTIEFLDKSTIEAREELILKHLQEGRGQARIQFMENDYKESREKSIFDMMQAGAYISNGVLFDYILKTRLN